MAAGTAGTGSPKLNGIRRDGGRSQDAVVTLLAADFAGPKFSNLLDGPRLAHGRCGVSDSQGHLHITGAERSRLVCLPHVPPRTCRRRWRQTTLLRRWILSRGCDPGKVESRSERLGHTEAKGTRFHVGETVAERIIPLRPASRFPAACGSSSLAAFRSPDRYCRPSAPPQPVGWCVGSRDTLG